MSGVEPDERRARHGWLLALIGSLTLTLALLATAITALSIGSGTTSSSSDAVQRLRLLILGLGLSGLVLAGIIVRLGRSGSRRALIGLLVIGGVCIGLTVLVGLLVPQPSPIHPAGAKPWAVFGLAVWILSCACAVWTNRRRSRTVMPGIGVVDIGPWRFAGAVGLALLLTVGLGVGGAAAGRAYTRAADSYPQAETLTPPEPAVVSELTGEIAWRSEGSSDVVDSAAGLVAANGEELVSVDRMTGRLRWRYFRSDLDGYAPSPSSVDGGRQVLVDWTSEHAGYQLLDADDGRLRTTWPSRYRDDKLEASLTDGALLGHSDRPSDSIIAVDLDGSQRWRFAPGRCTDPSAVATATVAVVEVGPDCGPSGRPAQVIGLDLATGTQLWSTARRAVAGVSGERVITIDGDATDVRAIHALDAATGRQIWSEQVPSPAGMSCSQNDLAVHAAIVQLACRTSDGTKTSVLRFTIGGGSPVRLEVDSNTVDDLTLTADGRSVVLAGEHDDDAARSLFVSSGGSWRRTRLPKGDGYSRYQFAVVGDQVLLVRRNETLLALR